MQKNVQCYLDKTMYYLLLNIQGLNVILSQYFNVIRDKYEELKKYYSDSQISKTEKDALLT